MKLKKSTILSIVLFFSMGVYAQLEDLTPAEIAYRDSIAKLNSQNDAIAKSQEAYNKGIQLFGEKNYKEAISGVEMYNLLGQKVLEVHPNATFATLNVSNLSGGTYFVKITSGEFFTTIKVVKK